MACKALTDAMRTSSEVSSLGAHVARLHGLLGGMKGMAGFKCEKGEVGGGKSPATVFPFPPLSCDGKFIGTAGADGVDNGCLLYGGNLLLGVLNWMHGGPGDGQFTLSAAHRRVHARMVCALRAMVLTDEPILSPSGLDSYTRQTQLYSGSGVVLALGVRGGVPEHAADVALADHLDCHFPAMGDQVRYPAKLLFPARKRPRKLARGYTWVSSSYPQLVRKNVKAGLHRFKRAHEVAKHNGKKVLAGAFAVVKDEKEDRVITDPSVNQLLDPDKLPRPRFAFIPSMRSVTVPKTGRILCSKRDARHYFHRLRIGRRWEKWLCGPPILDESRSGGVTQLYPASRASPMGFGPSAGWAQGLTDVVPLDANLPQDRRLHPDFVSPSHLPIWGSIIDDIWALEHVEGEGKGDVGPGWLSQAEAHWCLRGVEPNVKKSVDALENQEIQGYQVDSQNHWVGVKRRHLWQASMFLLLKTRVVVAVVDRLIGKHSFMHSCRPCLRSVFEKTYLWINSVRSRRRDLVEIPGEVWVELLASTLLLPFAQFDLSSPWSRRIECSDASMTGLGRAFGVIPEQVAQCMARYSNHGTVYTNLKLPWSIGLTTTHKCPLKKIRIPVERVRWTEIGVPWFSEHITLGEADAIAWAAEDRLRRPVDDGARFIHPVDSAACCGCFSKGRSSSSKLNHRCRKVCSVNIAGGHDVFYPWMASEENPADRPSRRFEPPGTPGGQADSELEPAEPVIDFSELGLWPSDTWFFIHLCSGPRRSQDVLDCIESFGAQHGLNIQGLAIDPLAICSIAATGAPGEVADLFDPLWGAWLMTLIHSGKCCGAFGSPPCSTISPARHVPLTGRKGPRPVRARSNPWIPLDYCTACEVQSVNIGSALFLLNLGLLGEVAMTGGWTGLEHPADRGCEPYPSFFATKEVKMFCAMFKLRYQFLHQCMYGASSKKPTGLILPPGCQQLTLRCKHTRKHKWLVGLDDFGHFCTTQAAKYPRNLCMAIAESFINNWVAVRAKGFERPRAPTESAVSFPTPWGKGPHGRWSWVEPSTGFLAGLIKALNHREIHQSLNSPQQ